MGGQSGRGYQAFHLGGHPLFSAWWQWLLVSLALVALVLVAGAVVAFFARRRQRA